MLYRALLTLLWLLTCNCSRLDLVTNYADSYVAHRAANFFDLNSAQKNNVKRQVASEIQHAKKEEVPVLCQNLNKTQSLTNSYEIFQDFKDTQLHRLEPKVMKFIKGLDQKQWTYFQNKLRGELDEKLSEISKYQKKQQKSTHKHLKEALGSLSSEQQKMVDEFFAQNPYPRQTQLESWQQILNLGTDTNQQWIKNYFVNPEKVMTSRYKTELSAYQGNLTTLLAKLDGSMSPTQMSQFKKFVQKKCQELS